MFIYNRPAFSISFRNYKYYYENKKQRTFIFRIFDSLFFIYYK